MQHFDQRLHLGSTDPYLIVVQWWDVLFVKGMHFLSKNARLLNFFVQLWHHSILV